ncbi:MAG TPA: LCP family protein [Patescibacteria group bacterium]|nr:LCP family protein [Patescibacteria group bacterium]
MAHKQVPDNRYTVGRTLTTAVTPPKKPVRTAKKAPQSVIPPPETEKVPKKRRWIKWLVLALIVLILGPPIFVATWDIHNFSHASQQLFGTSSVIDALATTSLQQSQGRVNILVIGNSADDPGHPGAQLTDSLMVISLSTTSKTGYILSIPRDLYVPIPGFSRAKINEAFQDGQNSSFVGPGYPNGGPGLLEQTIFNSLGLHTNYYVLLDYAAVRDITDALGGVTVTIKSSDPRGIYDPNFQPNEGGPLKIANGTQKVDGQTALRLTRARGAAGDSYGLAQSDFDRTKNQQAVFIGLKHEITTRLLLDPRKNKPILDAIGDNIHTDVNIHEAMPLYRLFNQVPIESLKTVTLRDVNGKNLLRDYATPLGQAALIPADGLSDFSSIQNAIENLGQ